MTTSTEMVHSVNVFILADRRVTMENISEKLTISVGTAHKTWNDEFALLSSVAVGFLKYWCLSSRPHTAVWREGTISQFDWEQQLHPLYSPDLGLYNFHLFSTLKEYLHGIKFSSNDKVDSTVSKWLKTQSKDFYAEAIKKLGFW